MKRLIAGIRAICTGLLVLLLVFSVFSLAVSLRGTDPPKLLGFTGAAVLSGSMDPYMKTGDFILVREQADYAVGDVVLFHDGGSLVTHRITRRTAAGFVTKGDANNAEDVSPVPPDVAEWWRLFHGWALFCPSSSRRRVCCFCWRPASSSTYTLR